MGHVRKAVWWGWAGAGLTGLAVLVAVGGAVGTVVLGAKAVRPQDPWHPIVVWAAAPYAGYALLGVLTRRSPPAAAALLTAASGVTAIALWLYASVVYHPDDALDGLMFFVVPAVQWAVVGATGLLAGVIRVAEEYTFPARDYRWPRAPNPAPRKTTASAAISDSLPPPAAAAESDVRPRRRAGWDRPATSSPGG